MKAIRRKKISSVKREPMQDGGFSRDPKEMNLLLRRLRDMANQTKMDDPNFQDTPLAAMINEIKDYPDKDKIITSFNQKNPDFRYQIEDYEQDGIQNFGFRKKEKEPTPRMKQSFRIVSPGGKRGPVGRALGLKTKKPVELGRLVPEGEEETILQSKQVSQTPVRKREIKKIQQDLATKPISETLPGLQDVEGYQFKPTNPKKSKKRQKMNDGGSPEEDENPNAGLYSFGLGAAGDLIGNLASDANEAEAMNMRKNEDPFETMKKINKRSNIAGVGSGILKGAAAGAAGGPLGMAIGAGVGLLASGAKAIFGNKKAKAERAAARKQYRASAASGYSNALAESSYKEGGKIKGKGGPKEDKVPMDVPEGSFIVPAENSGKAMELGKRFLGWEGDERAMKKGGKVPIKASNGEVMFTPDEVQELDFYGFDVNMLAPNAKSKHKKNFSGGGGVEENISPDLNHENRQFFMSDVSDVSRPKNAKIAGEYLYDTNQMLNLPPLISNPTPTSFKTKPEKPGTKGGGDDTNDDTKKKPSVLPEVLSLLQASAGVYGLASSKKLPDPTVASELRTLMRETKKLSETGMDPATRNYAQKNIEQARRAGINELVSKGGSAAEVHSGMTGMTTAAIEGHERLALADQQIRRENKSPYYDALKTMSGRKDQVAQEKMGIQERKEEMYANLVLAGIKNFTGARQFKEHLDYLKSVKSGPTFQIIR